ncbi:MAG: cytochrome c [Chloroflexaceae bacterium]|jgi:cytochrome c|nr:cytochrome c [Chloroflexaceae bacterium]
MDTITGRRSISFTRAVRYGWLGFCVLVLVACHQDMYEQPKYTPLEPSSYFANGTSARMPVEGTLAYGQVRTDNYFFTGKLENGEDGSEMPFPVTRADLTRGQEKYNIYCAPCHGLQGNGNGMVSRRGAITAANLHQDRFVNPELTTSRVGHFYDVITNGYRYMYPYASRIEPADRWRIAAYIRALQLSQNAALDDVPANERVNLERQP